MGSFSWTKADTLTQIGNVAEGMPFKFLIPKEFGGGFIQERYQDYGYLGTTADGGEKYDMYELLAFWNRDIIEENAKKYGREESFILRYDGDEFPTMKEIDEYTNHNRGLGINIGCYDDQIKKLKYPLKLVSASYKGTYEDMLNRSYGDPNQGFFPTKRSNMDKKFWEL